MGVMAAISQSVPDDVMMALVEYKTAKEAWAAIRTMRIGEARVTEARINQLMRKFDRMLMDDGETISPLSRRLNALVSKIRALGEDLQEKMVVKWLFVVVPDRFA